MSRLILVICNTGERGETGLVGPGGSDGAIGPRVSWHLFRVVFRYII